MICHGWVAMPHKLMVTLPAGTSGEPAAARALGNETRNCAPRKVAPRKRDLVNFIYSDGEATSIKRWSNRSGAAKIKGGVYKYTNFYI